MFDSPKDEGGNNNMNAILKSQPERYCSVEESLVESLNQVKLMQDGKLPIKTWEETKIERDKKRRNKKD